MRCSTSGRATLMGAILCLACPVFADTWHVNIANQRGPQDGKSWATAFTTIQPAIDAAHAAGGGEVWIATGTYAEPRSYINDGIKVGSLQLRDGVSVYGGFAGNETKRAVRDFEHNPTVISGKTSREGEAAFHVIIGTGKVRLDGVVVRDGLADGDNRARRVGGGLLFTKGDLAIENCIFADNFSMDSGAGVYVAASTVSVLNSAFHGNVVRRPPDTGRGQRNGGGLLIVDCKDTSVRSCSFTSNHCPDYGGGLHINNTIAVVLDCTFERNGSGYFAGGAYMGGGRVTVEDCRFTGNSSARYSGGLRFSFGAVGIVKNCRFEQNYAARNGGALSFFSAKPSGVTGCQFIANRATNLNAGALSVEGTSVTVRDSSFENNVAPVGAALLLADSEIRVDKCSFKNNLQGTFLQLTPKGSLAVTNSRIDTGGGKLLSVIPSGDHYLTLATVQQKYPAWTNNIDLAAPAPIPVAQRPAPAVARAASEPDAISIRTKDAEITVSGSNTVLYGVAAAVTIVFLVLAFGWVLLAQRRTGSAA